jgi:Ca2+-transporting ATPase
VVRHLRWITRDWPIPVNEGCRMMPFSLMIKDAFARPVVDVEARLRTDLESGLTAREAGARREIYGNNRLTLRRPRNVFLILLAQTRSPVVWLLLAAMLLAAAARGGTEVAAIGVVVIVNTLIGFLSEWRAERAMESLRALRTQQAMVVREGVRQIVPAEALVPGDIVFVEAGDIIPADLRIGMAAGLSVDESALTGESVASEKTTDAVLAETPLPDRDCMLHRGTAVTYGVGKGIVTATGMGTELGQITRLVSGVVPHKTPLEEQLARLSWQLSIFTILVTAFVTLIGLAGGRNLLLVVETAVALAVAAIPEGLPVVATLALARGMWRMAQRNALVERLAAVETLGAATLICTDKTGTLTENRMTVAEIWTPDGGRGVHAAALTVDAPITEALEAGVLCNNADFDADGDPLGDPMEAALLRAAQDAGMDPGALRQRWPRLQEVPFNSVRKMMATRRGMPGSANLFVKGAPEAVIAVCNMLPEVRESWRARTVEMAADGLRVLAVAFKPAADACEEPFAGLTFLGLIGFKDPPRADIPAAIGACRTAGIRVVMMTGDHPVTARNIAIDVGLVGEDARVIDGGELGNLGDLTDDRREEVRCADVFARVSPEQKYDLVRLHQAAGEIVAMTGDGVNDAPALKRADIGVAMGIRGTQVAREAAAMVLLDDAFSTIVAAIREGRVIFRNIQRFTAYLLSCNLSEILLVAGAMAMGLPLPLAPLQILFLNLVTDVFPAFALGLAKGDAGVLHNKPRVPDKPLLTRPLWTLVIGLGASIAAASIAAFVIALTVLDCSDEEAMTVSFLTLALAQLWNVFNMRDPRSPLIRNDIVMSGFIWGALALCIAILGIALYTPAFRSVLTITPPDTAQWALILGASLAPLLVGQAGKLVVQRQSLAKGSAENC